MVALMRRAAATLAALALVLFTTPANAALLTQLRAFSGSMLDEFMVTPFDPSLGTLDHVLVSIDGVLTVSGTTGVNLQGIPPAPVPFPFTVEVTQNFLGLAGRLFSFSGGPATFGFSGVASGAGTPFTFGTTFAYDFELNAATDAAGSVLPSFSSSDGTLVPPPNGVLGLRSTFVDNGIPNNVMQLIQQASVPPNQGQSPTFVTAFNAGGSVEIQYVYTPAVVPEPGIAVLLIMGSLTAGALALRAQRSATVAR